MPVTIDVHCISETTVCYLLFSQPTILCWTRLLEDFLCLAGLNEVFPHILGWKLLHEQETHTACSHCVSNACFITLKVLLFIDMGSDNQHKSLMNSLTSSPMMVILGKRLDSEAQMLCCASLSASVCRSLAPVCAGVQ